MRRLLRWALRAFLTVAVLGVAVTLALVYLPSVGRPSTKAIETSVYDELDGIDVGSDGCRTASARRAWRCDVFDTETSSTASYRVDMRGKRCWEARRIGGGALPRAAEGCVHLGHQLRPLDRLVD